MKKLSIFFFIFAILSLSIIAGCQTLLEKKKLQFKNTALSDSSIQDKNLLNPEIKSHRNNEVKILSSIQTKNHQQRSKKIENISILLQQKSNLNYNSIFSVPAQLSMDLIDNNEKVDQGWLGISMIEKKTSSNESIEEKQIAVQYVVENSPAEEFALQKDDIILKLNGSDIRTGPGTTPSEEFAKQIRKLLPETNVSLTISRNNVEHIISITLGKKPVASVVMADHKNLESALPEKTSLLETVLKQQNMLQNYYKVADLVREKSSDIISYRFNPANYNPFRLSEVNYLLHNPLNIPRVTQHLTKQINKYFNSADRDFSQLLNLLAKKIDVDYTPERLYKFPSNLTLDSFTKNLVQLFQKAASIRKKAFSKLSKDDIEFLFLYSKSFLPRTTEETDNEVSEEEEKKLLRFLKLSLKVNYQKLFYSGQIILHAFSSGAIEKLKQFKPSKKRLLISKIYQNDAASGDVIIDKETEIGRIIIGGPGQTIYWGNAAIIVDLGGDDIYYNNAGSSTLDSPLSLLIDLSGNDKYIATQPLAQGSGVLGTGILIDLAGDDIYTSRDIAQGVGILGSGFLIDLDGDDRYIGKSSVQGVGLLGIGFILEGGGNDKYMAERYAQGIGFTKGIGGIIEVEGSDYMFAGGKYPDFRDPENATESYAQGFGYGLLPYYTSIGTSGGIGLVYDQNGNDVYINDYFGQGSSYWYAFGALVDENGDDIYISGRYSQGAGIHTSVGIVIDEKGNDNYVSTFGVSQGCGHDFGIGVLVDNEGDDLYKGGVLVQGLGNETGIGIFYDNNGNDKYFSQGEGPGVGKFSSFHETGSIGLYVDANGMDSYSSGEKNNQVLSREGWGLFLDF